MANTTAERESRRLAHDAAALEAARPRALAAVRRLGELLPRTDVAPRALADAADEALTALAPLWEAATHLSHPW